jgi:lipid II:glycine glycyltransferase (peptidoglycan interpeptide bridge formation enzyme)
MDFKQKVRKNVKRANKNELKIIIENAGAYLDDFLKIYYSTMERSNAETEYYFSREFFETMNGMKDNIMYFHVMYDNKIISTELVIYGSENCYSYLGGTNRDYFELRPNDFLKYEIIKWAKEKGLKNFVLGGGYGADDGIFQYKTCLAPNGIVNFYIGRKIFDMKTYDYLVYLRSEKNPGCIESKYFPKYRG